MNSLHPNNLSSPDLESKESTNYVSLDYVPANSDPLTRETTESVEPLITLVEPNLETLAKKLLLSEAEQPVVTDGRHTRNRTNISVLVSREIPRLFSGLSNDSDPMRGHKITGFGRSSWVDRKTKEDIRPIHEKSSDDKNEWHRAMDPADNMTFRLDIDTVKGTEQNAGGGKSGNTTDAEVTAGLRHDGRVIVLTDISVEHTAAEKNEIGNNDKAAVDGNDTETDLDHFSPDSAPSYTMADAATAEIDDVADVNESLGSIGENDPNRYENNDGLVNATKRSRNRLDFRRPMRRWNDLLKKNRKRRMPSTSQNQSRKSPSSEQLALDRITRDKRRQKSSRKFRNKFNATQLMSVSSLSTQMNQSISAEYQWRSAMPRVKRVPEHLRMREPFLGLWVDSDYNSPVEENVEIAVPTTPGLKALDTDWTLKQDAETSPPTPLGLKGLHSYWNLKQNVKTSPPTPLGLKSLAYWNLKQDVETAPPNLLGLKVLNSDWNLKQNVETAPKTPPVFKGLDSNWTWKQDVPPTVHLKGLGSDWTLKQDVEAAMPPILGLKSLKDLDSDWTWEQDVEVATPSTQSLNGMDSYWTLEQDVEVAMPPTQSLNGLKSDWTLEQDVEVVMPNALGLKSLEEFSRQLEEGERQLQSMRQQMDYLGGMVLKAAQRNTPSRMEVPVTNVPSTESRKHTH